MAAECRTCGRDLPEPGECAGCAGRWKRAQNARGFLPTVELFPDHVTPAPAIEPEPEQQTLFPEA